jgi:hypothetical protein
MMGQDNSGFLADTGTIFLLEYFFIVRRFFNALQWEPQSTCVKILFQLRLRH